MGILKTVSIAATAAALAIVGASQSAQAGTLHNGWNYAMDSFTDGTEGSILGTDSEYELYGLAIKQTSDEVFVAINANLGLAGASYSGANDGHIGWGDMFFDFSGADRFNASGSEDVFGIRFTEFSDSSVDVGVYSNITTRSVTGANAGHSSFSNYNKYVHNRGGVASLGDLDADTSYFRQNSRAQNSIRSGTKIGDIALLDSIELADLGVDFGNSAINDSGETGNHTFGFSFDRSLIPGGNFIAHLLAECANDGVAIEGEMKDVPEPTAFGGLALLGIAAAGNRFRRRQKS
jgi:hypothetical protein